jgi:hypothetical protein
MAVCLTIARLYIHFLENNNRYIQTEGNVFQLAVEQR